MERTAPFSDERCRHVLPPKCAAAASFLRRAPPSPSFDSWSPPPSSKTPICRSELGALLVATVAGGSSGTNYGQARYDRVFSFGDSLTDTGNSAILPATAGGPFTNPPYGETHFKRPNGRASDGRLVIDFIVESLRLPQPEPYLAGRTADDFRHGVNFAVGGATALDMAFLQSKGITSFVPVFLSNQTTWFNGVLQLLVSPVPTQQ
ncbi:hypothetical protein ACQ4PT_002332 [Festuca glaucescens]